MSKSDDKEGSSLTVSVPSTAAMLVEFPGYVRDVRAALEVLGGEKALAAAAEGRAKYLKARLRPDDPLSHPLVSSAVELQEKGVSSGGGGEGGRRGLLLRVAKKNGGGEQEGAAAAATTTVTTTSVAAVVSSGVSFPGLADVQYAGWDARAPSAQVGRASSITAGGGGGAGGGGAGARGGGARGAGARRPSSSAAASSSSILPGEPLLAVPPVFFASDVAPAPVVVAPVSATTTDKAT